MTSRLTLSVLLTVALTSCQAMQAPTEDGVSAVQFADIVVPSGVHMVDRFHESHSKEEPGWRHGHFEYVGSTSIEEASSHVLQRMPQHNWRLVSDEQPNESTRRLRFERGRHLVNYSLQRVEGVTQMVVDCSTQIPQQ